MERLFWRLVAFRAKARRMAWQLSEWAGRGEPPAAMDAGVIADAIAESCPGDRVGPANAEGPAIRIAVVKQDVYGGVFCCTPRAPAREAVSSSLKATGMAGLFARFGAHPYVVATEPDPECQVWREKSTDCRQAAIEDYLKLATAPLPHPWLRQYTQGQRQVSVPAESVDWSAYDIVIVYDIAVPQRIIARHRRTLWAYMLGEPCMSCYKRSLRRPQAGYDVFLNQRFRRQAPALTAPHVVEAPYHMQYFGCFDDIFPELAPTNGRRGTVVETHTRHLLSESDIQRLSRFGPVRWVEGSSRDVVAQFMQSRYFLTVGPLSYKGVPRYLWGNAVIEAIAAGCLSLGDLNHMVHTSLFTRGTHVANLARALDTMARLEADEAKYLRLVNRQRRWLDWLCFQRPMLSLLSHLAAKRRRLGN